MVPSIPPGPVETSCWAPAPDSESVSLVWDLRICIVNMFPGDVEAIDREHTLRTTVLGFTVLFQVMQGRLGGFWPPPSHPPTMN